MSPWIPLLKQTYQLKPRQIPGVLSGSVEVSQSTKRLRLQCRLHPKEPFLEPNFHQTYLNRYFEQTNIDSSIRVPMEARLREQIEKLPQSGWAVQLFDADQSFRGRWDASFSGWKEVREFSADEGFVGGPFPDGIWRFVIVVFSPHLLNPLIEVEVEGSEEPDTPTDIIPFDLSCQIAAPESDAHWFAGELLERTTRSNGNRSVQETVQAYQNFGYSFLALSDLDMQPLSALPEQPQLSMIRGQIIPTPQGWFNALGVNQYLHWIQNESAIPLPELFYDVHAQGGLIVKLNPYCVQELNTQSNNIPWEHVDMLQVWEGFWNERFPEITKAFRLWDTLLNSDIRVMGVCGKGTEIEATEKNVEALPKLLVNASGKSEGDLLNAIKRGLCYSTVEPGIDFWVESEYGGVLTGDELQIPDTSVFTLRLDITGAGDRCFFRIITNDGPFCEMPLMAKKDPVQMKFTDYAEPKVQWYRVELYRYGRPHDELLAFSNPVFVRGIISYT